MQNVQNFNPILFWVQYILNKNVENAPYWPKKSQLGPYFVPKVILSDAVPLRGIHIFSYVYKIGN